MELILQINPIYDTNLVLSICYITPTMKNDPCILRVPPPHPGAYMDVMDVEIRYWKSFITFLEYNKANHRKIIETNCFKFCI